MTVGALFLSADRRLLLGTGRAPVTAAMIDSLTQSHTRALRVLHIARVALSVLHIAQRARPVLYVARGASSVLHIARGVLSMLHIARVALSVLHIERGAISVLHTAGALFMLYVARMTIPVLHIARGARAHNTDSANTLLGIALTLYYTATYSSDTVLHR